MRRSLDRWVGSSSEESEPAEAKRQEAHGEVSLSGRGPRSLHRPEGHVS